MKKPFRAASIGIYFSQQQCRCTLVSKDEDCGAPFVHELPTHDLNDHNVLITLLKKLKPHQHKQTHVQLGIPLTHTMVQQVTLEASVTREEIRQYLKNKLNELFGENATTLCWDYDIVTQTNTQQVISVAAIDKKIILNFQKIFKQENYKLTYITPDIFILADAFKKQSSETHLFVLVLVDHHYFLLTIYQGKLMHHEILPYRFSLPQLLPTITNIPKQQSVLFYNTEHHKVSCETLSAYFQQNQLTLTIAPADVHLIDKSLCYRGFND